MKQYSVSYLVILILIMWNVMMLTELHATKEEMTLLKQQQRKYVDTTCLRHVLMKENRPVLHE